LGDAQYAKKGDKIEEAKGDKTGEVKLSNSVDKIGQKIVASVEAEEVIFLAM